MPALGELVDEPVNPRWHLINLVPLWILQFVTSLIIGVVPSLCFISCGPANTPIQTVASALTFVCAIAIAGEAFLFAFRALTPARNAIVQSAKFLVIAGQLVLAVIHDNGGQYTGEGSWVAWISTGVMIAICCPPFSAHLLYALVAYGRLHSEAWRMKLGNLEESSVALLNDDDGTNHSTLISNNEERPQSPPHEAIEWPHIGRFFPIWILQLIYPLFLCFLAVATLGIYSIKSFPYRRDVVTYLAVGSSVSLTGFEIWSFCWKTCRPLSIHTYLRLQVIKVGILYLLLDIVVLSEGGFKFGIGWWASSLMAVFVMSIPLGSPFIAELVYAGIEYQNYEYEWLDFEALAPMFGNYIVDFNSTLPDVIQFTGVAILVLGFSNLFWVPLSSMYGRCFVLIASSLVCVASNIWRAVAKDYGSFMGASALSGFGAGPAETIAPVVIADLFFLHERGTWNTGYFVTYFGSLMVGPIIAGPMAQAVGWRSFWWLNVAILAFNTITLIFTFPETKWHRTHPSEIASASPATAGATSDASSADRGDIPTKDVDKIETERKGPMSDLAHSETAQQDPYLDRGKPSKAQFKLWQPADSYTSWWIELFTPWKLLAFPIVEFASFVVSWSASCFLTVNLTQAQNFAYPPYNYSTTIVGFFNFALLIGTFIGLATAGPFSDWVSMELTKRNNRIREPEMRLVAMIPYVLIMILGNVINAVGYQNSWDWRIIVIIGYTCAGIQVAAIPGIASTYAIDSYKPVAGSIFVSITINKNLWGYGFSKFITNWIVADGYIPPIMLNMSLTTLWCLFGVLFWFYGKTFRRWTRNDKVHSL